MSICSDVYISREKAREMVTKHLMYEQEKLVNAAVKNMQDYELTEYLNEDGSIYYYNIENKKKVKEVKKWKLQIN